MTRETRTPSRSVFDDEKVTKRLQLSPLWMATLIAASFGLGYQLYGILLEFSSEPTSSIVTLWYPNKFPTVTICRNDYFIEELFDSGNRSANAHTFAAAYLPLSPGAVAAARGELSDEQLRRIIEVLQNTVEAERDFMAMNMTLDEWLERASKPTYSMLKAYLQTVASEKEIDVFRTLRVFGTCFTVNTSSASFVVFESYYSRLHLQIDELKEPALLYIGGSAESHIPTGRLLVKPGFDYEINVVASRLRRFSTRRSKCEHWSERDMSVCLAHCLNSQCQGCQIYFPSLNSQMIKSLCNHVRLVLDGGEHCALMMLRNATAVEQCFQRCPAQCELILHHPSVTSSVGTSNSSCVVTLGYQHAMHSVSLDEQPSYSWDTFFSNLCGTVALWLGVSIVSTVYDAVVAVLKLSGKHKQCMPDRPNTN